jgi:hypothetical protein
MNIRFSPQEVRARISKEELESLLSENFISETIHLPGNGRFSFGIRLEDEPASDAATTSLTLIHQSDEIELRVARPELQALSERPAAKDLGIYSETPVEHGKQLSISLEVDIKTLKAK